MSQSGMNPEIPVQIRLPNKPRECNLFHLIHTHSSIVPSAGFSHSTGLDFACHFMCTWGLLGVSGPVTQCARMRQDDGHVQTTWYGPCIFSFPERLLISGALRLECAEWFGSNSVELMAALLLEGPDWAGRGGDCSTTVTTPDKSLLTVGLESMSCFCRQRD